VGIILLPLLYSITLQVLATLNSAAGRNRRTLVLVVGPGLTLPARTADSLTSGCLLSLFFIGNICMMSVFGLQTEDLTQAHQSIIVIFLNLC
jgi:hypothetical protein